MDWAAPEPTEVEIELDPRTPVAEQVEALFERARKLDRAGPRIDARIEETQLERGRLCAAIARLDAAATLEDAESVIATARREGWLPRERRVGPEGKKEPAAAPERKAYRTHHARDGWQILVGRSASDNDELTFKVANGNDYWFHVAGSPGSHVVARGPGEISGDTLLDAAMMAAVHSKAAGSGKVEVSYTRKKWVSKFRGARAGQVQMAQHKTMMVRIDEERVAAIRARPAAESGD